MPSKLFARQVVATTLRALACLGTTCSWSGDRLCIESAERSTHGADFVAAVARQAPAVVSVLAIGQGTDWGGSDELGTGARSRLGSERSSASGFVVSADGYILTSAHAVIDAEEISVLVDGRRRLPAGVVGLDRRSDLAVLKVAATSLPVAAIGSSAHLCAGEWVAALGAPFGFEQSVTAGMVSANPRFLPGGSGVALIQTDVALNPGSSGGPLFNGRGEVVGMNSMAYSASGGYLGVSFTLPIDSAMRIAVELRSTGRVTRGQIGARTQALTSDLATAFGLDTAMGALIVRVDAGGPAASAGLRSGDVVLGVDQDKATAYADIQERVAAARPGSALTMSVWRRKAPMTVKLTVAESAPDLPRRTTPSSGREQRLGLDLVERSARQTGVLLEPGLYVRSTSGSAQRAGLRLGDVVLAVNDATVAGIADLDKALESIGQGETVALLIRRGAITTFVPLTPPPGLTR
ncbi:putative periplasmic serine endoprotease DegP-like precursor [Variovorax sp. PBL-H6]|uniref:trypsin-like peptidase domain-containing protein n=1 Tax=Variovorax sp. PBL-H6 TaxID=434009 RepID=UPI001316044A|nr:trypsin-like peptidase domain-containing protein [Variovorax sp. PBL-H6]VTU27734.1 putative periplasmic serine endoprotease DegP-like precursor [Variovorax sp. PBL-H6]